MNSVMEAFCQRNRIMHETTNPYCPQQNSIAERAIAIFLEIMRCMLHRANMDLYYWGKAFMHAVYVQSLTLTSALQGKIPYTEWFDSKWKPDISYLCIFSSLGWAHVPNEVQKGKIES